MARPLQGRCNEKKCRRSEGEKMRRTGNNRMDQRGAERGIQRKIRQGRKDGRHREDKVKMGQSERQRWRKNVSREEG
jgi:hypothetical protein